MANTKDKILFGLISAYLVTVLGNITSDKLQDVRVLNSITSRLAWANEKINSFFRLKIELWIVFSVLVGLYLVYRLLKSIKVDHQPDYLEYTSDTVKEWVWKWSYFINQWDQYQMSEMTPYCPKCDVQLRIDRSHRKARCVNCNKEWDTSRNYVVYDSPHRGEWEDYTDTLLIIEARIKNYKKKTENS